LPNFFFLTVVEHRQAVVVVVREVTPSDLDRIPIQVDKKFVNSFAELKDTEGTC